MYFDLILALGGKLKRVMFTLSSDEDEINLIDLHVYQDDNIDLGPIKRKCMLLV